VSTTPPLLLKRDLFGTVRLETAADGSRRVVRDTAGSRWWARRLAGWLARREVAALRHAAGTPAVPRVLESGHGRVVREWIEGEPMQRARPRDPRYFREALRLVRRLHARRIAHNDLAKEPNWLVTPDGLPALVDFQLASVARRRGRLFRLLAHDDVRHLLKHKRSYLPERLTARQRRILATPSLVTRAWRATGKRLYVFVTRRLLGWRDREGAGDRQL
jgi:RIO-like serine/threonine protein kinase